MTIEQARKELAFHNAIEILKQNNTDADIIARIEQGWALGEMINVTAQWSNASADEAAPQNYIQVYMVGLRLPFDRLIVEIIKKDRKSAHELRREAEQRLDGLFFLLDAGPSDAQSTAIVRLREEHEKSRH
jgi:hypothetical protein